MTITELVCVTAEWSLPEWLELAVWRRTSRFRLAHCSLALC